MNESREQPAGSATPDFMRHSSEVLPWKSSTRRDRDFTSYEATIPPSIKDARPRVSDETAELCRQAAIDVALLESTAGGHLTSLEPFLLRTEAVASSKIEGEIASVDQIARVEAGLGGSRKARTIMGAARGLASLIARAQDGLTLGDLLDAHRQLMAEDPTEAHYAGRIRDVQNWVGGSDYSPRGAVHVPPQPARVLPLMEDLLIFANRRAGDPLVQASLIHAQFESIHPFTDGNGRVGRSLINGVWRFRNVTATVAVPVASAIVARQTEYFSVLNEYRDGHLEPVVNFIATATSLASREARDSAVHLANLPREWRETVRPRRRSCADKLIDLLLDTPIVDVQDVRRLTDASQSAAYEAIGRLEGAGVLRRITESERNMTWAAAAVLDEADVLLDRIKSSEW